MPSSYSLHSSDSSIDDSGHHFEEAIFADSLSTVARASVFDIGPGSFPEQISKFGGATRSGTSDVYVERSNNPSRGGVFVQLSDNRMLVVNSSISLAHAGQAHSLSSALLVQIAAHLVAKL